MIRYKTKHVISDFTGTFKLQGATHKGNRTHKSTTSAKVLANPKARASLRMVENIVPKILCSVPKIEERKSTPSENTTLLSL